MPRVPDDMTDLDHPLTRREFRAELHAVLVTLATKDDLKAFATKDDLKAFATKDDLKAFATKDDLKLYATKKDLEATRDELVRHIDIMVAEFKGEFRNLYDWTKSKVDNHETRIVACEQGFGTRLSSLENRVTRLEGHGRARGRKR